MSRTLLPLAGLAMAALIVAGCSNAPSGTGTGSGGGNNTATNREQRWSRSCSPSSAASSAC
jgi:hypothetical protein